uniref:Uncharacterized protein n=1 Tax=Globodera rostochiensis TaxID=31243 RepID=A0A914HI49_GLORO
MWKQTPPTACAYRAILRTQTCVLNGPRQPARAQHVRVLSSAGTQTCVLNGPRQPARTQHVRVLSAAGYVETEVLNSMRLSCNSKSPNVCAEWSASTRARPTPCAYRAILRAQTCVLNGPRQPARAQHVRVLSSAGAQTCVLNGPRQPARAQHVRVLSSAGAQTCVLNGPRQPARAQHVRVLSAAGYVETEVLNSMRLSCNSKSPNVCAEWSASTRARPTRARFICGWICGNRSPQQHALIVQF